MKVAHTIEGRLREAEAELHTLLHRVLPLCAEHGTLIFLNSENLPSNCRVEWLPPESDELLRLAKVCAKLRQRLGSHVEKTVDQLFLQACAESSDTLNEQRRGPRKLAAWLLAELKSATSTEIA